MNITTVGFENRELEFEVTVSFSGGRKATYGNLSNHWGSPAEEAEMEIVGVEMVSTFSGENLPDWQEKMELESAEAMLYEADGMWEDIYKRAMDQLSAAHDSE